MLGGSVPLPNHLINDENVLLTNHRGRHSIAILVNRYVVSDEFGLSLANDVKPHKFWPEATNAQP